MSDTLTVVSLRLPVVGWRARPTPVAVRRQDVLDMLAHGAQVVDVRGPEAFAAAHLPGAVNVPLPRLDQTRAATLDPDRPVILYCSGPRSDLSSRAAWRLISLGLKLVYRYTGGQSDWQANGLPIEGALSRAPSAGSLARMDVPTCRLHDALSQLRLFLDTPHWDSLVVINDERVVLGSLSRRDLDARPQPAAEQVTAEQVMQVGPVTIRADAPLARLAAWLRQAGARSVLVTTTAGQLVGLLCLEDIEQALVTWPSADAS